MITMNDKKDLTIECEEKSNSVSDEYIIEIADASFGYIDEVLFSLSKMLDNHLSQEKARREPKTYELLSSRRLKVVMVSELMAKRAEEYVSPAILKVLLESLTVRDIFHKGDSIKIDVLPDNTLRISGERPRGNE